MDMMEYTSQEKYEEICEETKELEKYLEKDENFLFQLMRIWAPILTVLSSAIGGFFFLNSDLLFKAWRDNEMIAVGLLIALSLFGWGFSCAIGRIYISLIMNLNLEEFERLKRRKRKLEREMDDSEDNLIRFHK